MVICYNILSITHIISKLDSLVFIPCSGSEDPDPDPKSSIKSSLCSSWSPSGLTLANCHAGMEGGTTGVFATVGNCFLQEKNIVGLN